jgi:hypothetical protein
LTLVPPTLNLPGPVQALRLKYRNKVNYGGRFAVIKTSGFKSEKAANDTRYGSPKENEFIAMLPLNVFLKLMANPTELADRLTVSVEKLMAEWMLKNSAPGMAGKRRPNTVSYNLDTHIWRPNKSAREERSTYVMSFSTYNFTVQNANAHSPKITPKDVKVGSVAELFFFSLTQRHLVYNTFFVQRSSLS